MPFYFIEMILIKEMMTNLQIENLFPPPPICFYKLLFNIMN